jgi:prepilin-type N-terminal cleavage/methylation domain-containing protein
MARLTTYSILENKLASNDFIKGIIVKRKNKGFTLVEVMTTVTIIVILVALLIPALSMVRRMANETAQKAQFAAIDMAIMAFRNDFGDYPPLSSNCPSPSNNYCGAQRLAEALLGWDLLGFHPNSQWTTNGRDCSGILIYDPNNLDMRRGPYLETSKANAFKLGDLFGWVAGKTGTLAANTFVMCDVFAAKQVAIGGKTVKAGTPILYYKANTSSKSITVAPPNLDQRIYNVYDNDTLVQLGAIAGGTHPLGTKNVGGEYPVFYNNITDPKITTIPWPYRPDSYILISAGADGLYGTSDDIRNF